MFYTYQTVTELKLAYNYSINHNINHNIHVLCSIKVKTCIYHPQYLINANINIFDVSIQLKLCQYCITGLMYHNINMVIYRYIVASLAFMHSAC